MEEYKPNSHKSKEEQKNLVPEKTCRESDFWDGKIKEKIRNAEVCRRIHF